MKKEFLLLILACAFKIDPSFAENGDCTNLENIPDRNFIHDKSLEVDPCGNHIFKKCSSSDGCTTEIKNASSTPFQLIVQEYNFTEKLVKVAMMIHVSLEYFIQVRPSAGNGTFDSTSEKLGYFVDLVFPECNSFACCGPSDKPNVARRCKDAPDAPTKAVFNKNFYTITFAWHPPEGFKGPVLFVFVVNCRSAFSQSNNVHWENIISKPIYVAIPPPPSRPPPILTTTTSMPSSTSSSTPLSYSTGQPNIVTSTISSITDTPTTVQLSTSTVSSTVPEQVTSIPPTVHSKTKTRKPRTTLQTTLKPKITQSTKKKSRLTTTKQPITTTTTKGTTTTKSKKVKKVQPPKLKTTTEIPIETTSEMTPEVISTTTPVSTKLHRSGLVLIPHHPHKKVQSNKNNQAGPKLLPAPVLSHSTNKKSSMRSHPKTAASLEAEPKEKTRPSNKSITRNKLAHNPKVSNTDTHKHIQSKNPYAEDIDYHPGRTMEENQRQQVEAATFHGFASSRGAKVSNPYGSVFQASPYSASIYHQ